MIPVIGIDPGTTGAACYRPATSGILVLKFAKSNRREVTAWLQQFLMTQPPVAVEKVRVNMGQNRTGKRDSPLTAWQFGKACGKLEDRLDAAGITEYDEIDPQTWQREFSLVGIPRDEKQRRQVAIVEDLFELKVTQDAAAAILIAEYYFRKVNGVLEGEKRIKGFSVGGGAGVVGQSDVRKR